MYIGDKSKQGPMLIEDKEEFYIKYILNNYKKDI